jgi:hypothetical protein
MALGQEMGMMAARRWHMISEQQARAEVTMQVLFHERDHKRLELPEYHLLEKCPGYNAALDTHRRAVLAAQPCYRGTKTCIESGLFPCPTCAAREGIGPAHAATFSIVNR